ncbi:hypothetical protein ILUMI_06287 [Ignelater luminosus]|uniref:Uncharacterized protein n=1 Tax=Ignelater luminosus TaxID=2038154 RepID=A0A8K0D8S4_IGNLU|nr:hypothetical protein ILUMI_06287 [Ignelater luminosus]
MNTPKLNITRIKLECSIFGSPIDLNRIVLPTIEQQEPSFAEVCNELVPKIENIWKPASIPMVSRNRILQLIGKYHDTREKARKVHIEEQKFLLDQKSSRKMIIGNVDRVETKNLTARKDRQSEETERLEIFYDLTPGCFTQVSTLPSESHKSPKFFLSSDEVIDPQLPSTSTQGSLHVFKTIEMSRYLREDLRGKYCIDAVIHRNAYFIHPENLLLCKLTDNRRFVRELALKRIIKVRQIHCQMAEVRHFVIPKLNYWNECDVSPLPVLADLPHDVLEILLKIPQFQNLTFRNFRAILNRWKDALNWLGSHLLLL